MVTRPLDSAPPLLVVDDLHAGYQGGVDILQGLSLRVREKSLTLVIGPNGAGKSTLLKTIFGFLKPHRGRVRLRDEEITGREPHALKKLGVSYMPQEINTFPMLSVEENLRMGAWTFRRDRAAAAGAARAHLRGLPRARREAQGVRRRSLRRPGPHALGRTRNDGGAEPPAGR